MVKIEYPDNVNTTTIESVSSEDMSTHESEETFMELWEAKNQNISVATLKKVADVIECKYPSKIKKLDIITKISDTLSEKNKKGSEWLTDELNQKLSMLINTKSKSGSRANNIQADVKIPKKKVVKQPETDISDEKEESPKIIKKKVIDYSYLREPKNILVFEMKISELEQEKINKQNSDIIISVVKSCHEKLFHALNMNAHDCRNDILTIILLKLLEPIMSDKPEDGKIDLLNPKYAKYTPIDVKYLSYLNLSKLITDTDNLRSTKGVDNIKRIGGILTRHEYTSNLFENENIILCPDKSVLKEIIDKINNINIDVFYNTNDIMGYIAEYFNAYLGKAKEFQTHLTPRCILKSEMLFNHDTLIKKLEKCKNDGKKFIVGDYCMGTAGWLITFITHFKKYSDIIELGGGEIQTDMYRYSLINILTTTKRMPKYTKRGNSLCMIDNEYKYQAQFENPPFSSKIKLSLTKDQYKNGLLISDEKELELKMKHFDTVYGLKQNNAIVNFLEVKNITLEDGGYCSIIVGYGAVFNSSGLTSVRAHFMKIYDIKSITVFPRGIFQYTSSATCKITFIKGYPTKEIQMLKTNMDCSEITLTTTVKMEDINKHPNKSWMVDDYLLESKSNNDIEYIEFGKLFTLEKGTLASGKVINDENGEGVFVNKGDQDKWQKINTNICSLTDENIFIARAFNGNGKCPIRYYNGVCICSNLMFHCKLTKEFSKKVNLKFVYYYLKSKQSYIEENYQTGQNNQSLNVDNFNRFPIPLPAIERQNQISIDMDECMLFNDNLKNINDGLNKMINKYMTNQIRYMEIDEVEMKELGEICDINNGERIVKSQTNRGIYNVYGGGNETFTYDKYNRDDVTCKISRFAISLHNCVQIIYGKYWLNDSGLTLKSKDKNIINKFVWYYLLINKSIIYNKAAGANQKNLNISNLLNIKIPIPSIEKQNEIVEYCDYLMNAIKTNNNIIQKNKELINENLKL